MAGVFADAAPDSWGRRLLERAYGNGLNEFEYLTLSDDTCRQGALRFLDNKGEIIRGKAADAVPRLVDLETLTAIARAYEQGKEISPEQMQTLAGAGGSGGARPKANVRGDDALWLAKFTSVHDQHPIERVEVATLRLAAACTLSTSPHTRASISKAWTSQVQSIHKAHYRQLVDELTSARKSLGMNQEQLAAAWGRTQTIIARIETYERRLDIVEFLELCDILIVDPIPLIAVTRSQIQASRQRPSTTK